jgi:UbiD family decarboxylase
LRTFLAELPEEDILRISDPTELDYLPTALILELEKRRRTPVVMIERPKGFDSTVVMNLFASRDRIARMVGAESDGFNDARVHALAHLTPPTVIGVGPVHDRVLQGNELDAGALPISRHYEKDAGRYIGSGILVCKDPDTGVRNLERLQLKGANRSLTSRYHVHAVMPRGKYVGTRLGDPPGHISASIGFSDFHQQRITGRQLWPVTTQGVFSIRSSPRDREVTRPSRPRQRVCGECWWARK